MKLPPFHTPLISLGALLPALAIAALLLAVPGALWGQQTSGNGREITPAPGSPERQAICDAARAHLLEKYFNPSVKLPRPVVFKISRIAVRGDYCSFEAVPIFNDGSEISTKYSDWIICTDLNFCLKKSGGAWSVIYDLSLSDVPPKEWFAEQWRIFPKDFPFALLTEFWQRHFGPFRKTSKPTPSNTTGGAEGASRKIFKNGEDCELDGTLSIERGENESWLAITLAAPIRVASADSGAPVSIQTLQIAGLDQSAWEKANKLAGKSVHVIGRLMEAHTRYHHTPVLIIASQLQPQ